jgi:ElaB/YqjD/DUF883 family membrane-anchored ribosome-binding protein
MAHFDNARQHLVDDLHQVLSDMEELVRAVATDSKEKVASVKPRAEAAILRARARIADLEGALATGAAHGLHAADTYAHTNPWQTAGFAAGLGAAIGAILGALIARR